MGQCVCVCVLIALGGIFITLLGITQIYQGAPNRCIMICVDHPQPRVHRAVTPLTPPWTHGRQGGPYHVLTTHQVCHLDYCLGVVSVFVGVAMSAVMLNIVSFIR